MGKHQTNRDGKMQNDKGFMNQTLTVKRWVLIESVHIVP